MVIDLCFMCRFSVYYLEMKRKVRKYYNKLDENEKLPSFLIKDLDIPVNYPKLRSPYQ